MSCECGPSTRGKRCLRRLTRWVVSSRERVVWVNFQPARKALERLEERIGYLESLTAALIHPNLWTKDEEKLAKQTPHELFHPPFKATPGSQELMHRAVEMVD